MMECEIRARVHTRDGEALVVRRLGAGDGARLQAFDRGLGKRTRRLFLPHAYDDRTVAKAIRRATNDDDRVYVVSARNAIVGYFFLWYFRQPVPVLGIGLTDAYQDRGLGAQLMAILIEDARQADRDAIDLTTMPDNDRAFALYRKMGFEYMGDVDNVTGDGSTVIERWMFLPLKPGVTPVEHVHEPPV